MRDLLRNRASTGEGLTEGYPQETALLADYLAFLQLARRYDRQQETLRRRLEEEATERGEQAEHVLDTSAYVLDKSALYSGRLVY